MSSDDDIPSSVDVMYEDKFYLEIEIELDRPIINRHLGLAHSESRVQAVKKLMLFTFNDDGETVKLSQEQERSVAYPYETICFVVNGTDLNGKTETFLQNYEAKNGAYFTVAELADTIIEYETKARNYRRIGQSIDLEHRIFEGLLPTTTLGLYELNWVN